MALQGAAGETVPHSTAMHADGRNLHRYLGIDSRSYWVCMILHAVAAENANIEGVAEDMH